MRIGIDQIVACGFVVDTAASAFIAMFFCDGYLELPKLLALALSVASGVVIYLVSMYGAGWILDRFRR